MTATLLSDRAVIRLSPQDSSEDVGEFLQGLVTNDVTASLPVYAGLLSAQGKALFDFLIWGDGDDLLLDCEVEAADELAKRLSMYRLRRKIVIARDEALAVHWQVDEAETGSADPRLPALGTRWIAPMKDADTAADESWRKHRLAHGVAEGRAEMGDILWLETNAAELHGVSFEKGCYVGQENTARMNWRQKVGRRLVVVPVGSVEEKRVKAVHDDLDLAIAHLRIDDIPANAVPEWMILQAPEG